MKYLTNGHKSLLSNESEILQRIAQGSESEFKNFFISHAPSLQAAIQKMAGDESLAREIVQETFIKIWLSRDKLPSIDNINAYLYRTAVNFFIMYLRKAAADKNREQLWSNCQQSPQAASQEYFSIMELKEIITTVVNSLPDRRKKIFLMSREKGMSITQIAKHLNIAESTVKNSISEALTTIRQRLAEAGYAGFVSVLIIFLIFFPGG